MIDFVLYILLLCTVLYGLLELSWRKWTSKFNCIPGPPTVPWLGTIPYLKLDPSEFLYQMRGYAQLYNNFFIMWLGHRPMICTAETELTEHVLKSQDFLRKSTMYDFLHDWLGTGLLTSWGEKWKKRRRVITPSFHFSILNDFTSIFTEQANVLVSKLRLHAKNDKVIDIQPIVRLATLDVICETAMGIKINAQTSEDSEYVKSIEYANTQLLYRMRMPLIWPRFIYQLTPSGRKFFEKIKGLHRFTTDVINKRIETRKNESESEEIKLQNVPKKKAFLDMLLDLYDKGEIDVKGIREEVDTFMFEGHDTTGSGLSWIMYLLGKNPEVQQKLHDEIDKSNAEKVHEIKYLEFVIKEGLRMHAPVGLLARVLEEDTVCKGFTIPKGTEILISPLGLHTNPDYWDDPLQFKPERFGEEEFYKRNPFQYVPFSAGARNCIGQKFAMLEMKIVLYHILKNFHLKSLHENEDDLGMTVDIIHKASNGLQIQFSER